jgi:hypothetical protein
MGVGGGVMLFFVLSGFLIVYHYINLVEEPKEKKAITFTISHISKLYFLSCIVVSLSFLLWTLTHQVLDGISVLALISNFLLIQSWIPYFYYHYNFCSITWFISDLVLFYLLTNISLMIIKKIKKVNICIIILVSVAFFKLIYEYVVIEQFGMTILEHYLVYIFPLYRFTDYFCGLILGRIWMFRHDIYSKKSGSKGYTLIEVFSILFFLFINYIASEMDHFQLGVFLLPSSLLLIYVFAWERGRVSWLFHNRIIRYLGDRTPFYYLIHISVLHYTNYFFPRNKFFGAIIAFFLTYVLGEIYVKKKEHYLLWKVYENRKKIDNDL